MSDTGEQIVVASGTPLPIAKYVPQWFDPRTDDDRLRLHIGGKDVRAGWKILNIQAEPGVVDFVGNCCDLSGFGTGTVSAVYASHVLEHVSHREELPRAISEIRRVLDSDGVFLMSVPDMKVLCELFLDETLRFGQRHHVMRILFGGQNDEHDYHRVGLWRDYLVRLLREAGFHTIRQVREFGLFNDASTTVIRKRPISLNLIAQ